MQDDRYISIRIPKHGNTMALPLMDNQLSSNENDRDTHEMIIMLRISGHSDIIALLFRND